MHAVHNIVKMMGNGDDSEEELAKERTAELNELYYEKTMHTMEVLMSQMNLMYYCEKVRLDFADHEPNLQQLEKLMSRSLKMYHAIDSFSKVFKLIHKKEVSDNFNLSNILISFYRNWTSKAKRTKPSTKGSKCLLLYF